ncbi:hypothetical protein V2J09_020282 [Rumex salicifolius]
MVRGVVGEESRLQLAEDRLSQSGVPVQVGLVIGKLSSALDRGFVFDLVPTPFNDAGEPPCSLIDGAKDDKKKGSKPKSTADSSSLFIDKDWVAEHARQVSRMLVGGVKVIGIYTWVGDAAFKNSTLVLCQTVKGVAEAAPLLDSDERLLIHICYSPRRWACKNCSLASNITSNSLRPCDFKMGRVISSLQRFGCNYSFNIRLPIYQENISNQKTLSAVLQDAIYLQAKELRSAKAIIDGTLVVKDEPFASDGLHEVELLMPFMKDAAIEASSEKEVAGILDFSGSVCSYAYLNSKEPCTQALADIKEDIIASLKSRLDVICDEADAEKAMNDDANEETNEEPNETTGNSIILQPLRKQCTLEFPRRVFIPWLSDMFICDYLQPTETLEDLKGHFSELLSMDSPEDSSILQPERRASKLTAKSVWNAPKGSAKATEPTTKSHNNSLILAVLVLLLSIVVGLVLFANQN